MVLVRLSGSLCSVVHVHLCLSQDGLCLQEEILGLSHLVLIVDTDLLPDLILYGGGFCLRIRLILDHIVELVVILERYDSFSTLSVKQFN